jgi:hypothetical protein
MQVPTILDENEARPVTPEELLLFKARNRRVDQEPEPEVEELGPQSRAEQMLRIGQEAPESTKYTDGKDPTETYGVPDLMTGSVKDINTLPQMSARGVTYHDYINNSVIKPFTQGKYRGSFYRYGFGTTQDKQYSPVAEGSQPQSLQHVQKYAFLGVPYMWENLYADGFINSPEEFDEKIVNGNFGDFVATLPEQYQNLYKKIGEDIEVADTRVKTAKQDYQIKEDAAKIAEHKKTGTWFEPEDEQAMAKLKNSMKTLRGTNRKAVEGLAKNNPVQLQTMIDQTTTEYFLKNSGKMSSGNLNKILRNPEQKALLGQALRNFDNRMSDYVGLVDPDFQASRMNNADIRYKEALAQGQELQNQATQEQLNSLHDPAAIEAYGAAEQRKLELELMKLYVEIEAIAAGTSKTKSDTLNARMEAMNNTLEFLSDDARAKFVADLLPGLDNMFAGVTLEPEQYGWVRTEIRRILNKQTDYTVEYQQDTLKNIRANTGQTPAAEEPTTAPNVKVNKVLEALGG